MLERTDSHCMCWKYIPRSRLKSQKASCFHRSIVLIVTATSIPPLDFRSLCGTDDVDAAAAAVELVSEIDARNGIAIAVGMTLVFVLEEGDDDDDDDDELLPG